MKYPNKLQEYLDVNEISDNIVIDKMKIIVEFNVGKLNRLKRGEYQPSKAEIAILCYVLDIKKTENVFPIGE